MDLDATSMDPDVTPWWDVPGDPRLLSGRDLRYQLTQIITERGPVTVADLVEAIDEMGFDLPGRSSKVVSDALRWEIVRGRIVRMGRGRYRLGTVPRTTAYRIARRSHELRRRAGAATGTA